MVFKNSYRVDKLYSFAIHFQFNSIVLKKSSIFLEYFPGLYKLNIVVFTIIDINYTSLNIIPAVSSNYEKSFFSWYTEENQKFRKWLRNTKLEKYDIHFR